MNHNPVNSLGSLKISLQSAILGCEVKPALQKAAELLRAVIVQKLPDVDNLYFPVDLLAKMVTEYLNHVDTIGDAAEIKISAQSNTISVWIRPLISTFDDPCWKLLQNIPIRNHKLAVLFSL